MPLYIARHEGSPQSVDDDALMKDDILVNARYFSHAGRMMHEKQQAEGNPKPEEGIIVYRIRNEDTSRYAFDDLELNDCTEIGRAVLDVLLTEEKRLR